MHDVRRCLGSLIVCALMTAAVSARALADEMSDAQSQLLESQLQEARMGQWTEDFDRLLDHYAKVLELDPHNVEAQQAIQETRDKMRPTVQPRVAWYRDSEDLAVDSYGTSVAWYLQPATRLQFQYAYTMFAQDGRSTQKNAYQLKLNHRLTSQLAGGLSYTYNDYTTVSDKQSFHGDLYYQWTPQTALYLAFTRQGLMDVEDPFEMYGWNIVGDIDAIVQNIYTNDTSVSVIQRFSDALRYVGNVTLGYASDGNTKTTTYHELDWRFWKHPSVETHVKYNYFLLDYAKNSPFYWSPNFFDAHSAVLTVKGKVAQRLSWMAESGASISPEGTGVGYLVASKAAWDMGKDWALEGSFFYFRQPQSGRGDYWARKFTAAFSRKF